MLKALSNSKLFFLALGATVAIVGVRASAAPSDPRVDDLNKSVERIADTLEKLQRDGLDVNVSQKWGSDDFRVKVKS